MCPVQHTYGGQRRIPGAFLHCFPLSSLEIRFLIEPKTWHLGCKIPRIFPVPTCNSGVAGPCNHAQLLTRVLRIWTQFLIHGQQAVSHLSHSPWFPLNDNYFLLFAFNCAVFHMRQMCEGLERWLIQQCVDHTSMRTRVRLTSTHRKTVSQYGSVTTVLWGQREADSWSSLAGQLSQIRNSRFCLKHKSEAKRS